MRYLILALLMTACGGGSGPSGLTAPAALVGACATSPLLGTNRPAVIPGGQVNRFSLDADCNFVMSQSSSFCTISGYIVDSPTSASTGSMVLTATYADCPHTITGVGHYTYQVTNGQVNIQ